MTMLRSLLILATALVLTPIVASQANAQQLGKPIFCDGTYALCIKAACKTIMKDGKPTKFANCECDVQQGVSMGPQSCAKRQPVVRNGRTYLISTYSNLYNKTHQTMSCSSSSQQWTWCYGKPCVVDSLNPSKTTCKCPIFQSAMQTLGGECGTKGRGCNGLWSAAKPRADNAANRIFALYQKKNGNPHFGPAAFCPPTTTTK
jgi:hypothetical protein